MRILVLVVAIASLSSACSDKDPVSRAIGATVGKGAGTRLVLAEHTRFEWEKVCILGPYTPDDKVDALTGIQGAAREARGIYASDAINVLMFIREGRIAASVAHPRAEGDFGPELVGKCYSREQADFTIRRVEGSSRGNIGPA